MPTTINTKTGAITVKQGEPSAPGEVVDTSKARVVPPSSEVKTEAAAREVAAQGTASRAKIGALAKGMTGSGKPAAKGKGKAKPAAAKPRGGGNGSGPVARLTNEWLSKSGKDVKIGDHVKLPDGTVINVIGRWTRRKKDETLTPMITGRILTGENKGTKKGERKNAVAAEVTHVAKK
jgi:hypothetical protein